MTTLLYHQKAVLLVLVFFFVPFRQRTLFVFFTTSYATATNNRIMSFSKATPAQLRRAAGSCKPSSLETFKQALRGWTVDELNQMGQQQQHEGQCDGKNPLHMAAWQGSLEILQYLVDEIKMDVNVISRAKFSYGKTAIFFACTRGRNEHVQFLLQRHATVLILNNKGQSPLSLASSHLEHQVILEIQQAERHQIEILKCTWINYRATHSDGLDYGDQDPRFFTERPLTSTDSVTEFAINPTTRQLRKGILFRLNPHLVSDDKKNKQKQPRRCRQPNKRVPNSLSPAQQKELQQAWSRLLLQSAASTIYADGGGGDNPLTSTTMNTTTDQTDASSSLQHLCTPEDDLISILQISDQQQLPWLPTAADRLVEHFQSVRPNLDELECLLESAKTKVNGKCDCSNNRLEKLLEKFTTYCLKARHGTYIAIPSSRDTNTKKNMDHDVINNNESETVSDLSSSHHSYILEDERGTATATPLNTLNSDQGDLTWMMLSNEHRWKDACQVVKDFTIFDCFEGHDGPILALSSPPTWIQTVSELAGLEHQILQHHVQLVAMDSEWWCPPASLPSESNCSDRASTTPSAGPQVATIQLAVCHSGQQRQIVQLEVKHNNPELVISSWVVDLLYEDEEYQAKCKALVRALFHSKLLLGFAVKQDIHKLNRWLQDTGTTAAGPLQLQQGDVNKNAFDTICIPGRANILDVQQLCAGSNKKHQLPGLAACVSRFAKKPLCKRQQCSDWGQRPLTDQQLEYAGLDAAILLALVAEIYRQAKKTMSMS